MKAVAEKLIPGIPENTRISILQQTRADDANTDTPPGNGAIEKSATSSAGRTVLEEVVERATARHDIEREIRSKYSSLSAAKCNTNGATHQALASGVNSSDPFAPVKAVRKLKHERLLKKQFLLDKDARLRSGARGMQARKALIAGEKAVAESAAL